MSEDIVDDLHAAEDRIGTLETALRDLINDYATAITAGTLAVEGFAGHAIVAQQLLEGGYCRVSCAGTYQEQEPYVDERGTVWHDDPCDPECGCPCGHNGEEPPE